MSKKFRRLKLILFYYVIFFLCSHSLSSLTGADESDEDSYHDARENPTPSQSMMNLSMAPDSLYGHHRNTSTAENMYIHSMYMAFLFFISVN